MFRYRPPDDLSSRLIIERDAVQSDVVIQVTVRQ